MLERKCTHQHQQQSTTSTAVAERITFSEAICVLTKALSGSENASSICMCYVECARVRKL